MSTRREEIQNFVNSFTEETRTSWNEEKEWWEPTIYFNDSQFYEGSNLSWLCDNLGDAQEAMEGMWVEILRLRKILIGN